MPNRRPPDGRVLAAEDPRAAGDADVRGYAVGGILVALIGKQLIETYGWQSVFFAAGAPVLLIPFIMKTMPESMPFLIKKNRRRRSAPDRQQARSRAMPMQAHEQFLVPAEDRADERAGRQAVPRRSRLQHGDDLDRVLHGAVHGLRAQLVVDQADGDGRLQPGLGTDLRPGVQRAVRWLAPSRVAGSATSSTSSTCWWPSMCWVRSSLTLMGDHEVDRSCCS